MGVLRTFLALCVIAAHTEPFFTLGQGGAVVPVRCFYVISGFYMALVLTEKYSSALTFYKARLLRLFPMYWAALGITIAVGYSARHWDISTAYSRLPLDVAILTTFSNAFLVGQDWLYFIGKGYESTTIIGQAWTLSVELTFYALAPLLVRCRSWALALVVLCTFGARNIAEGYGLVGHPWDYRFFPLEFPYFLLGMFAYRFYAWAQPIAAYGLIACAVLVLATLNPDKSAHFSTLYMGCVAVTVPFIFAATKDSRIDSAIGELSYPLYITHMIFVTFFAEAAKNSALGLALWVVALSLALSVAFVMTERLVKLGTAVLPPLARRVLWQHQ